MVNVDGLKIPDVRIVTDSAGPFEVIEYVHDSSVAPSNAMTEYFMAEMEVRRRQLLATLSDGDDGVILQAGAMQMMFGNVDVATNVNSVGGFLKGAMRGKVTGESAIKPLYRGSGQVLLEPTYKYIILEDLSDWSGGIIVEDGMFLASTGGVEQKAIARKSVSSALAGNEGLFNLGLFGNGVVALESNVHPDELLFVEMKNDVVRIDGSYAIAWSPSLDFTVERTTSTLIGSAASGEGLVNVYRGTGNIVIAPVTPSSSLFAATHS